MSVHGTVKDPVGEGSLQLRGASLWGEPVRNISAQLRAGNKSFSAKFSIAAPAGNVGGDGEFSTADSHYRILVNHSVLNLAQIRYLSSHGYTMAGTMGIEARGEGTLRGPGADVPLAGERTAVRGAHLG